MIGDQTSIDMVALCGVWGKYVVCASTKIGLQKLVTRVLVEYKMKLKCTQVPVVPQAGVL